MVSEQFTTEEGSVGTSGSAGLLVRFVRSVPVLWFGLLPTAVLSLLVAGGYQAFVWLSGQLAECSSVGGCKELPSSLGVSVAPSLTLLVWIAVILLTLRIVQWVTFEAGGQLGCRGLVRSMVRGVGRARTTFFDEYPSGKIINRFVKDADALRVYGPVRIGDSINALIELVVVAIVISHSSLIVALFVIPVLLVFIHVQRNVAPMLQHVLTLRSARFGEVLHRESDVIEGVRSFLLYGHISSLMKRFSDAAYRFMQMHFLRGRIEAGGRLICDVALALYTTAILWTVYLGIHHGKLSTVVGAVIITAAFRLGTVFNWLTWSLGQVFETAGQARRVFEYVDLPPEELEEGRTVREDVSHTGVERGTLEFVSYSMRYRATTPVILRGISLTIPRGEKVGLVGRTGAGKSSLVQALFRMVYVEGGDIRVGGESVFSMELADARNCFAVVPQDPYLFEGTIRSNIDRLEEHSDDNCRAALDRVGLSLGLDMKVLEGGVNLSLGQRQLLCLARVLLSKRGIVLMDEPTSGVDTITDATIQEVLRTALADRTIITIAHRLETLARQDRIVELEEGRVVRDGPPIEVIPQLTQEELA